MTNTTAEPANQPAGRVNLRHQEKLAVKSAREIQRDAARGLEAAAQLAVGMRVHYTVTTGVTIISTVAAPPVKQGDGSWRVSLLGLPAGWPPIVNCRAVRPVESPCVLPAKVGLRIERGGA